MKAQLHTFLISARDGLFTFTLRPTYGGEIGAGTDRVGPKGGLNQITGSLVQGRHYADWASYVPNNTISQIIIKSIHIDKI